MERVSLPDNDRSFYITDYLHRLLLLKLWEQLKGVI
jgi:hypothetical protein